MIQLKELPLVPIRNILIQTNFFVVLETTKTI